MAARPRKGSMLWPAVAAAFADVSIVVLALPDVIGDLGTSISTASWVIIAYSLALLLTGVVLVRIGPGLEPRPAMIAGLVLFGVASLACGVAQGIGTLIVMRCVQGVGGGLLLGASLSIAGSSDGEPVETWARVAAIGLAAGPAVGGVLTEFFDWRAIFLAQAPVAALALPAVSAWGRAGSAAPPPSASPRAAAVPLQTYAGLALLASALTCALFLVVLMLIDVWGVAPILAAVTMTAIPLATLVVDRFGRSLPTAGGTVGAAAIAAGLLLLSLLSEERTIWLLVGLLLVGSGLGLAVPGLTRAALRAPGPPVAAAAKTVVAHEAGIVFVLLALTPILVARLDQAPKKAVPKATEAVLAAPMPVALKLSLVPDLIADYEAGPAGRLPDFGPAFDRAATRTDGAGRSDLDGLHGELDSIVERTAASAFAVPLRLGACFALLAAVLLAVPAPPRRRRRSA
ncbi:MAG: MFS transporter [Solirubrobacterales bacterium]